MAGLIVGILAAVGTFSGSGESISTGTSSTPAPTTHTPTTLSPSPTTKPTTVTPTPTLANGLCPLRGMYLSGTSCVACPTPKKTFSVFWESQVDCSTFATSSAAAYVTHIYWSFALIDPTTGTVSSTFQGSSATLKACIAAARAKCIKNYVSIGGATMRQTFVALNSSAQLTTFALSAAQVVQEYGFDGVDIDDESGNLLAGGDWKANALPNVLVYLQGLKTQLAALPRAATEPKYQITWDEFPTSLSTGCDLASGDYLRCFDVRIANIVDQVNIMMYNSASSTDYDNFLNVVTPTEWATAMPASKIVIGGCVGPIGTIGGCAFGAAPTATQLKAYASLLDPALHERLSRMDLGFMLDLARDELLVLLESEQAHNPGVAVREGEGREDKQQQRRVQREVGAEEVDEAHVGEERVEGGVRRDLAGVEQQ
uniref:Secreted protein n=1 Tax=Achlya hypogyna TaxID=1202772 RepID=A0A0A7CN64_ACHHY|nr:secreted protein [Achlya hypogyna]